MWSKIGLSAWSAGYGAVGEIINQSYGRSVVDVVILLDGLHSGYGPVTLNEQQLAPFVRYAREAKAGRKLMFVSHSSIIPPGISQTRDAVPWRNCRIRTRFPAGVTGTTCRSCR